MASANAAIPVALLRPILEREMPLPGDPWTWRVTILARQCKIKEDSLQKALERETISFDLADMLLCQVGIVGPWPEPLTELYHAVELPEIPFQYSKDTKRCAARGCNNTFVPNKHTPPGRQKYCSPTCKATEWQRQKDDSRTLESKILDKCPNGHDRSPENAILRQNGKRGKLSLRCRECETARYKLLNERRRKRAA